MTTSFNTRKKTSDVETQRLRVSNYLFPAQDGSAGAAIITDGFGTLSFSVPLDISGLVCGAGSGVDERVMRWDGSECAQSSVVALNDAGDMSGITSINVAAITYPTSDGTSGQVMTTDGAGVLTFTTVIDVSQVVGGAGSGVDERLMRWDGSEDAQSSVVALNDAGDMSGITSINVAAITYPTSDGTSGQVITTDGAGVLTFTTVIDVSQVIGGAGSGVDERLMRWDGSEDAQSSVVALNDAGDMSGVVSLHVADTAEIGASSLFFDATNTNTVFAGSIDICGSGLGTSFVAASHSSTISDASSSAILASIDITMRVDASSALPDAAHRSVVIASDRVTASSANSSVAISAVSSDLTRTNRCMILGSQTSSVQDARNSIIMSSDNCLIDSSGTVNNAIIASTSANIGFGARQSIISSTGCNMTNLLSSSIIGCTNMDISNTFSTTAPPGMFRQVILASEGVDTSGVAPLASAVWGGVSARTWLIDSNTGTYYGLVGAISTAVPDFAEYFENEVNGVMPPGSLVTLNGDKIRLAEAGDDVMGIVSAQPALVAGGADMNWQGIWQQDQWGKYITNDAPIKEWVPGPNQTLADAPTVTQNVKNPAYDPTVPYIPRKKRPKEWSTVGLTGQVRTRVDATVDRNDFVKTLAGGMGTKSIERTNIRCMRVCEPYSATDGYAIVLCLIK